MPGSGSCPGERRAAGTAPRPDFHRPIATLVGFIDGRRHDSIDGREFGVEPICRVLSEHGCPIATYDAAKTRPVCVTG
jgi:hypothetical protein